MLLKIEIVLHCCTLDGSIYVMSTLIAILGANGEQNLQVKKICQVYNSKP